MTEYLKNHSVGTFPVPEGIKFISISLETGLPDPNAQDAFMEAFVKDTPSQDQGNNDDTQGIY